MVGLWVLVLVANPDGGIFAGPTTPSGGLIYWNPAATAKLSPGVLVMGELTGLLFGATYQREPEDPASEPVYEPVSFTSIAPDPNFLGGFSILPELRFVVGGYSPLGLGSNWPEDGPQRYHATRNYIVAYALAGGLVYSPHPRVGLALLGGPTYFRTKIHNAMDFGAFANQYLPPGADLFAREDPQLQGWIDVQASGVSSIVVSGAWFEPVDGLELGVGLLWPQDVIEHGQVAVTAPDALSVAVPSYRLAPRGDITVNYPMPWTLNVELALDTPSIGAALMFQWASRSEQKVLLGEITEAKPQFIEGRQVSVKGARDDWMVSARVSRPVSDSVDLAFRADWDPRYIPKELITPINVDFTTLELSVGARIRITEGQAVTLTYGYVYLAPIDVVQSAFNPRAPAGSGLDLPSPRGHYEAWAHKLTLSYEGLWPAG